MKRRLGLLFLITLMLVLPTVIAAKGEDGKPAKSKTQQISQMDMPAPVDQKGKKKDANDLAGRVAKYKGLDKDLGMLEKSSQPTIKHWSTSTSTVEMKQLAEHSYEQVAKELTLLRQIAVSEKADKTVTAIDALLNRRGDRLKRIASQIEKRPAESRISKVGRRRKGDDESDTPERKTREERREERRKALEERRSRRSRSSEPSYD